MPDQKRTRQATLSLSPDLGDLADLISQLWRHGQRATSGQRASDTAQAASQETPHPLACDLKLLWHEQIEARQAGALCRKESLA